MLNRREFLKFLGFSSALFLSSCTGSSNTPSSQENSGAKTTPSATNLPSSVEPSESITETNPSQTETTAPSPTEVPLSLEERLAHIQVPLNLDPLPDEAWKELPIIPSEISNRMLQLFALGQEMEKDARQFSVIGDCHSSPVYFLKNFEDLPPNPRYTLGAQFEYLQETIDYYKGSFNTGLIPKNGQNVAGVFSPFWVHQNNIGLCEPTEGPLACELRLKNSSFVLIGLEKNWVLDDVGLYTESLENVILYTLAQGVIPVLSTKASNLEGDHGINQAIVEVSRRYDLPLWNFWASVQDLPNGGLEEDLVHLSLNLATYFNFTEPERFDNGWAMRNLTALRLLDFMRKALVEEIGLGHQLIFQLERWLIHG